MTRPRLALVKPPERTRLNFGCFSLAVLAAYQEDVASIRIFDLTDRPIDEAVGDVMDWSPDIIGITTMAVDSVGPAVAVVRRVREAGFCKPIIAGGHGAMMLPLPMLEGGADAVVYGEGESTLKEIIASGISEEVRGLFLLRHRRLLKTLPRPPLDLDQLPPPARHLMTMPMEEMAMLETSRGCPHRCAFCETTRFHGIRWRGRSPENVARDVHELVAAGARIITIADDNFLASPIRARRICERLNGKDLPLFFIFSARSDDLLKDPELIPSLAKSRFLRLNAGIETAESGLSATVGKEITYEQHRQAFTALRRAGIYTVASFIVGLPGETEESRKKSLDAAIELADSAVFLPFQPLPGIDIGDGSCRPEPWSIECAEDLTRMFLRHPSVLNRLLDAAKAPTVRGMLARASLGNRLKSAVLDETSAQWLREELSAISPNRKADANREQGGAGRGA